MLVKYSFETKFQASIFNCNQKMVSKFDFLKRDIVNKKKMKEKIVRLYRLKRIATANPLLRINIGHS